MSKVKSNPLVYLRPLLHYSFDFCVYSNAQIGTWLYENQETGVLSIQYCKRLFKVQMLKFWLYDLFKEVSS